MYLRIDVILWLFLQNLILLPYDYLIETDEYEIFKVASHKENCVYVMSYNDIFDSKTGTSNDFYFDSFENMLTILEVILEDNCLKKNLIIKARPIINRIAVEHMFQNIYI
jgi:hypothetical protein